MTSQRELRDAKILVSLEDSLYEAVRNYVQRNNMSASGYARSLIIRDMHDKGLLSDSDVMKLASGA